MWQNLWRQIRQAVQRAQRSGRSGRRRSAGQKTRLDILFLLTGLSEHCSCVSSPFQQGVDVSCLPGLAHRLCGPQAAARWPSCCTSAAVGSSVGGSAVPPLHHHLLNPRAGLVLQCARARLHRRLVQLSPCRCWAAAAEGMFHTRKHQLQARAAAVGAASPSSAVQGHQLI